MMYNRTNANKTSIPYLTCIKIFILALYRRTADHFS